MRQDWSEGNRQYNQFQHIYIDFFYIIQLTSDIQWLIVGDEAPTNDISPGENVSWALKNNVKVTVNC